jgi:phycobilisome core-membrane linker protein
LAVYRQVMVLPEGEIPAEWRLVEAEAAVKGDRMTLRAFIGQLVQSPAYQARFVAAYPAPKLVAIMARQLLGRNLEADEAEYQAIATRQGAMAVAEAMLSSAEYLRYFGEQGVPYRRA